VSAHSSALLAALREAGPEGLDEAEMANAGGLWWRNRVKELQRRPGVTISEWDAKHHLTSEPSVERTIGVVASGGLAPGVPKCPDGSLSTEGQLVLLEVDQPATGHHEHDLRAA
jgi:hypothetical protein